MDEREDTEDSQDQIKTGKKFKRASWTDPQRSFLIELLHLYNNPHHRGTIGWNQTAWIEITKRFNTKFPHAFYNIKQLKEQEQAFKKAYKAIKGLIDNYGFEWDEGVKKLVAHNIDNLEGLIRKNPVAKEWHNKTYLYYSDLAPLYGGISSESHKRRKNQVIRAQNQIIRENGDDSPKTLEEPSRNSGRGLEEDNFINSQNTPLLDGFAPNFTENVTPVQNLIEAPAPQQEASSQNKRKRRKRAKNNDEYLDLGYKKSETPKYNEIMKKHGDVASVRLELENKRVALELENVRRYSFKNAMDLFDSLEGFSFEDYDKVTKLFMKDEKVRDAFIDVKEEYKARWIRLRIDDL